MAQRVHKDSMGRYNHPDVPEDLIPNTLISPTIDIVHTSQDFSLHRGDLIADDFMLLETQCYSRNKKPNQLKFVQSKENTGSSISSHLVWRTGLKLRYHPENSSYWEMLGMNWSKISLGDIHMGLSTSSIHLLIFLVKSPSKFCKTNIPRQ